LVKKNYPTRNYTTIYIGLTPKQAQKLRNLAKRQGKTESEVLRQVFDDYLKDTETKGLLFVLCDNYNYRLTTIILSD